MHRNIGQGHTIYEIGKKRISMHNDQDIDFIMSAS